MPRYLIKRSFDDRFQAPADNGGDTWTGIISRNAEEGVNWLHSYVSDDGHTLFCVYDAPTPEAIRKTLLSVRPPGRSGWWMATWRTRLTRGRFPRDGRRAMCRCANPCPMSSLRILIWGRRMN